MKRLHLNFAEPDSLSSGTKSTTTLLGWLFLVLGLIFVWIVYQDYEQVLIDKKTASGAFGTQAFKLKPIEAPSLNLTDEEQAIFIKQIQQLNQVAKNLRVDWDALFLALESARSHDIDFLQLNVVADKRLILLNGEAKDVLLMTTFLQQLEKKSIFSKIDLQNHTTVNANQNSIKAPIKFTLQLTWREEGMQ